MKDGDTIICNYCGSEVGCRHEIKFSEVADDIAALTVNFPLNLLSNSSFT